MTNTFKQRIIEALREQRRNFGGSDAQYAVSLDINPAQLSRMLKGELDRVISQQKLEHVAQVLGVTDSPWKAARTQVLAYIHAQLEACQQNGLCAILVDRAGIGKTFAAQLYKRTHQNVIYIDCSQAKTKRRLMKAIARQLGIDTAKTYDKLYEAVTYALSTAFDHPIVILDEMGDLKREAILEVKALWNATQYRCAWYAIGADGLQNRIDSSIKNNVVGFVELFSRFGATYNHVAPQDDASAFDYLSRDCMAIIKLNAPEMAPSAAGIIKKVEASPRGVYNHLRVA